MQLFAAAQTVKALSSVSVDPGIQHFSFTGILSVSFSGDFQLDRAFCMVVYQMLVPTFT